MNERGVWVIQGRKTKQNILHVMILIFFNENGGSMNFNLMFSKIAHSRNTNVYQRVEFSHEHDNNHLFLLNNDYCFVRLNFILKN